MGAAYLKGIEGLVRERRSDAGDMELEAIGHALERVAVTEPLEGVGPLSRRELTAVKSARSLWFSWKDWEPGTVVFEVEEGT